jgi:hypothetical protein
MATRCEDINLYQTGNDSRDRAFIFDRRSEEGLMGHGEREQDAQEFSKSFYGQIRGSGWRP